ncbi:MAG: hypothetical protein QXX08_07080 [Candidatus Bathyarchaeia archaeon]
MKRKASRKFSSFSYYIQKIILKTSTYRPSRYLIAAVLMGSAIFLLGGGVYDILIQPYALLPVSGRYIFFYPYYLHEQLLNESIGIMILYALGVLGLFFIYRSTRYVRNPRQFSFALRISVILFVIAFIAVEVILFWKLTFGFT